MIRVPDGEEGHRGLVVLHGYPQHFVGNPRADPPVVPDRLLAEPEEHEEDERRSGDRPEEQVELLEGAVSELDRGVLANARKVGVNVRPADVREETGRDVDIHRDGGKARPPDHLREGHGDEQQVAPRGQRGVAAADVGHEVEALLEKVVEGESWDVFSRRTTEGMLNGSPPYTNVIVAKSKGGNQMMNTAGIE